MRKKVPLFICAFFFLCSYVFSQKDARIVIAVNDLKGSGMERNTDVRATVYGIALWQAAGILQERK